MTEISIIIPVYNSCLFLEDCVQSLLSQTFKNFEIWLINDGSTDGSGILCDKLREMDNRIQVVHTQNNGAAYARKLGVEHASGNWLLFVDSDDTMPEDGLERLYKATVNSRTDIVVGFCRKRHIWDRKQHLSPEEYRNLLIEGRYNIGTLWGKLFRRSLFEQGIPDVPRDLIMGEDMLINIYLAFRTSNTIQFIVGKRVYNYIQRDTGISKNFRLNADYEKIFHKERLRVIPLEEHKVYMNVMIHRRLRMLKRLLNEALQQNSVDQLMTSEFVVDLIRDIQDYHYLFIYYPHISLWKFIKKAIARIDK